MPIEYCLHAINNLDIGDLDGKACSLLYQRDFSAPIINDDKNASISEAGREKIEGEEKSCILCHFKYSM